MKKFDNIAETDTYVFNGALWDHDEFTPEIVGSSVRIPFDDPFSGVDSRNIYNLTNSTVDIHLTLPGSGAGGVNVYFISDTIGKHIDFYIEDGIIDLYLPGGNDYEGIVANPTHTWFRFVNSPGALNLYGSSNGTTWTLIQAATNPGSPDSNFIKLWGYDGVSATSSFSVHKLLLNGQNIPLVNLSQEKAFRRGYSVPPGAVNVAWAKSPTLSPQNNTIIIDTSRITKENTPTTVKNKQVAFANHMGILEDINGNQIWDEEYPVISDQFLPPITAKYGQDLVDADVLPYVHISRHFHVDLSHGIENEMVEYKGTEIKVVHENETEYVNSKGDRQYKVFVVPVDANAASDSDTAHRVYIFIDMQPGVDRLYVKYNKVEISSTNGSLKNQQIDWKETVNPRPYFKYIPEESDVVDYPNTNQKIYSTKPTNLKQKIMDLPQNNYQGWKLYVPRKAIADPRIFQLFRWRLACEYTRSVTPPPDTGDDFITPIQIRVGVVVTKTGNHLNNRANFLFHQLNSTDYNFSKMRFYNPLQASHSTTDQNLASYWHVNIDTSTHEDLQQFDILVWAPNASAFDFTPYLQKINHYVENSGGTFVIETSSLTTATGVPGITFGPRVPHPTNPGTTNVVTASSMRLFDATASNPNDEFSSYGKWKEWPPNIQDILTSYTDTGSILTDASPIAGWDMTVAEKNDITTYNEIPNTKLQYLTTASSLGWKHVLQAQRVSDSSWQATMAHKKYVSGGNLFVSTGGIFEDHLFEPSGDMIMRTMNLSTFSDLAATYRNMYNNITSANVAASEMKLRINTVMLATVFKPSPPAVRGQEIDYNADRHSLTIYTDWFNSWVIDAGDGVLTEKEINDFQFVLQTVLPTDLEPVWQRVLSGKTLDQLIQERIKKIDPDNTSEAIKKFAGATKRYFLICTNPLVEVPPSEILSPTSVPIAWTEAYSPKFEVPYYRGPYAVRDEMIAGTGVGEGRRIFPPKTWAGKVSATYLTSSAESTAVTAKVKMTATVRRDLTIDDPNITKKIWHPPVTTTTYTMKDGVIIAGNLGYTTGYQHQQPDTRSTSFETWTDSNYKHPTAKATNWPHWERFGRHGHPAHVPGLNNYQGASGPHVLGIQRLLNIFIGKGYLPGPYLKLDGYYGVKMHEKIWEFQRRKGAQVINGVTDSETWSLLGHTLRGIQSHSDWGSIAAREGFLSGPGTTPYPQGQEYKHWAWQAQRYLDPKGLSDNWGGTPGTMRQSNHLGAPPTVNQTYLLKLNTSHALAEGGLFRIYRVLFYFWGVPQECTWLDVGTRSTLVGAHPNMNYGYPGRLSGIRGDSIQKGVLGANQSGYPNSAAVAFTERKGNSITFNLRNLGLLRDYFVGGYGSSTRIGISAAHVYVRRAVPVSSTTPGYWQTINYDPGTVSTITKTNTITYEANVTFKAGVPVKIDPMVALAKQLKTIMADEPPRTLSSRTVSTIKWNPASVQFPNDLPLINYFDVVFKDYDTKLQDRNDVTFTFNGYGLITKPGAYITGPMIGTGTTSFYTKSPTGKIDPYVAKYGWISKDDGIKLVCDSTGKPLGFPAVPIGSATNMHFANYILDPDRIDQTTYMGFYDNKRKEWVVNSAGDPEMTYYDYIRRGPLNVYIGIMTTYELDIQSNLPSSTSGIQRPFKWAMPVYGISTTTDSRFQIAPLPPTLSSTDIWSLPIRTGRFDRAVQIRPKTQGSLTGTMKDYQGKTVNAYYNAPEANNHSWSKYFGRPYSDIYDEQPVVLDDNVIQVRQYPILQIQEPTATPSITDPWVPVMKVEVRQTLSSPWVEVELADIEDYDLANGIVTLEDNLPANDARLVRVSYTSESQVFNLKHDGTNRINLNPYINDKPEWRNVPLYVYVIPEYVTDSNNNIIPGTTQTRTLKITTDPSIFNPTQVDYDPLAIMLGMIYITTAFDIKDLSILDTRRRGGGITAGLLDGEAVAEIPEADSFWDVIPDTATSYQKGGFIIVRLPKELTNYFTEEEVNRVIERNVTAGTAFKLETLEGESLEWVGN